MSGIGARVPGLEPAWRRYASVLGTVTALAVGGGIVGGLFGVALISGVLGTFVPLPDAVLARDVQFGFLLVAVAYLAATDSFEAFVRVRRPTPADVLWVLGVLVALVGAFTLLETSAIPSGEVVVHGGGWQLPALAAGPVVARLLVDPLIAAPAEELLFRGIVQGRLRVAFGPVPAVAAAAVLFGLLHAAFGLLQGLPPIEVFGWGLGATVFGFFVGAAYERTDNLLVPAAIHVLAWTNVVGVGVHALL